MLIIFIQNKNRDRNVYRKVAAGNGNTNRFPNSFNFARCSVHYQTPNHETGLFFEV
ncbi:hypothetical protein SAMN04487996_11180 [Dyadobacter soli]|uniref:Uncharacterized protein n=1 Tax=Dyadobacter soli TaxID=659014 RepID=A0A1G7LU40_9BACT|nr:hypothetical protein SAMN04487996_11180 [Dyadobacter soli]